MSVTILHTADTHIGYQQYHQPERKEDFNDAFKQIVDNAIDQNVDVVVHAGDLFHRSRPSISDLQYVVSQLQRLSTADIPFYMIVGNHDQTREHTWPLFFQTLGLATYLSDTPEVNDQIAFYGLDYVEDSLRSQLNYHFKDSGADKNILVAHGLFEPFEHGKWDMEEILNKSSIRFDIVLAGDDHTPGTESVDETVITYPGSSERTAADQRHSRGYNVIKINSAGTEIDWTPIKTRDFVYIDIELGEDDGTQYVRQQIEQTDIPEGGVIIVTLTGDGERVPPAGLENIADRKDALTIRVNDRRDFTDAETDIEDSVGFVDPDNEIDARREDLELTPLSSDLDGLARSVDTVPKSNLRDKAEQTVAEAIEEDNRGTLFELTQQSQAIEDLDRGDKANQEELTENDDGDAEHSGGSITGEPTPNTEQSTEEVESKSAEKLDDKPEPSTDQLQLDDL